MTSISSKTLTTNFAYPSPRSGDAPPEVLAVIPARGGSKGITGKNIRALHGKPLIAYTIEAALRAPAVTRVVVSTDSEIIATEARRYGAEVPFLRPAELSGDRALVGESVQYTVRRLGGEGYHPLAVAVFYPTHPFRPAALVDFLTRKLLAGYSPVFTYKKITVSPGSHLCRRGDGHGYLFEGLPTFVSGDYARRYGLFVGHRLDGLKGRAYAHVIDDPIQLVDIDHPRDLALAEAILASGLFRFEN
uniref:CMP-N-acetylneuraminic acid synthetase n=1 Tax=Desulfovibrio sp. U5L TaxID=596152 RepID=I2Q7K5_9BACT